MLSKTIILSLISLINLTSAKFFGRDETTSDDILTAFVSDVDGNIDQYLTYVEEHSAEGISLLTLLEELRTFTDDSYTKLGNAGVRATISQFVTGLPWYTERFLHHDVTTVSASALELDLNSAATTSSSIEITGSSKSTKTYYVTAESTYYPSGDNNDESTETESTDSEDESTETSSDLTTSTDSTTSETPEITTENKANTLLFGTAPLGVALIAAIGILI
ncbi:hypothetical protein B5S32_g2195 [[Candida] boidinii]|nr:hypothetical protein B5S32_g2195 [[Candida] boidinii]